MIRGIIFPTQDVALVQGRGELGFDIKVKEFPVYRPVDDPGCIQPVMAQRGDEEPAPDLIRGLASAWRSNRWRIHASIQWPKGA